MNFGLYALGLLAFHCLASAHHYFLQAQVRSRLYILLRKWIALSLQFKIPYFVTGGTLLGAIRNRDLIQHDDDLDIGIETNTFEQLVRHEPFQAMLREFGLTFEFGNRDNGHITHRIYLQDPKYRVFMDIFEYTIIHDVAILSDPLQRQKWSNDFFFIDELNPLQVYPIRANGSDDEEMYVCGPQNPIPYLKRLYGAQDFLIPRFTHSHMDQIVSSNGSDLFDVMFISYFKYVGAWINEWIYQRIRLQD